MTINEDADVIEEIEANTDLLAYASQTMDFVRRGDAWYAHCPKHVDKTASLCVTPSCNKWFCFSCRHGGNIVNFMQYYEGMSHQNALAKAASLCGMDLSERKCNGFVSYGRAVVRALNKQPIQAAHELLDYTTYDKFAKELPQEWIDEGIKPEVMEEYDVRIDKQGNRIVYPVYDMEGNLINIKGRTRNAQYKILRIPKYINYYKVGTLDYLQGYGIAAEDIRANNEVIIFEGIKSCMKARGWGFKNCVSAETHDLTMHQVMRLASLHVRNIVLCWDSDVDIYDKQIYSTVLKLKRIANVYAVVDVDGLLGGTEAKCAPVDCGRDIWVELYNHRKRL